MSNQTTSITDGEIRSVLYRMAAHVGFFAEPATSDPKAAAFADIVMGILRSVSPPEVDTVPPKAGELRSVDAVIDILNDYRNGSGYLIPECTTVADILNHRF